MFGPAPSARKPSEINGKAHARAELARLHRYPDPHSALCSFRTF